MSISGKQALLHVSRALGLFGLARWRHRNHLRILCYHGFATSDEQHFRAKMFVTREVLESRFAHLKRNGYPVLFLGEALAALKAGTLPKHATVITVDDGFSTTRTIAAPLLAKY